MIQHKSNTITASTKILWLYIKKNCAITQQGKKENIVWKKCNNNNENESCLT